MANPSFGQQEFLNELGTEKAESFSKLVKSYERFLQLNYPNIEGVGAQTRAYIHQMVDHANYGKEPVDYDSLDAIEIITELEQSGLRKDICMFSGESYDTTYNLRQFLTEEYSNEIDESIAFQETVVYDSLWDAIPQELFDQLTPKEQKIEKELEKRRDERSRWGSTPTPKGLFHYALLKTDTSFSVYCLMRATGMSPAITQALMELSNSELKSWNVQVMLMVDYYLGNILFRYRRHMKQATNSR